MLPAAGWVRSLLIANSGIIYTYMTHAQLHDEVDIPMRKAALEWLSHSLADGALNTIARRCGSCLRYKLITRTAAVHCQRDYGRQGQPGNQADAAETIQSPPSRPGRG